MAYVAEMLRAPARESLAAFAAGNTVRVLEDAAERAPMIAAGLHTKGRELLRHANVELTSGIPRFTWNGMDDAGNLYEGMHPVTAGELHLRYAWNDQRAIMLDRMYSSLSHIRREHPDFRYVGGGGSFFGSGKPDPGDIDLALLDIASSAPHSFTRVAMARHNNVDNVTHVYPGRDYPTGIPGRNFVDFFSTDRNHARRGMVLLDLDELGIPAGKSLAKAS